MDKDFLIAQKLQELFDAEDNDELMDTEDDDVLIVQSKVDPIVIDDDDNTSDGRVSSTSTTRLNRDRRMSRDVTFGNEVQGKYVIEELGQSFDPKNAFDWKIIKFEPNIKQIVKRFNQLYFSNAACLTDIEIGWARNSDDKATFIRFLDENTQIMFHEDLKLVPRIDLIGYLLRAMLIIYIRVHYSLQNNLTAFQQNFNKVLAYVNKIWMTNILETAKLKIDREKCRRTWWRCTGACIHHSPFHGIYRSEGTPGAHNYWWMTHRSKCGGTLFKVYEYTHKIENKIESGYVVNTKYMEVKIDLKTVDRVLLKPKEVLDLTEDDEPRTFHPRVLGPIDLVSMENSFRSDAYLSSLGLKPAQEFIKQFDRSLGLNFDGYQIPCPICEELVPKRMIAQHFDGCQGQSKTVNFVPLRAKWQEWPEYSRGSRNRNN